MAFEWVSRDSGRAGTGILRAEGSEGLKDSQASASPVRIVSVMRGHS